MRTTAQRAFSLILALALAAGTAFAGISYSAQSAWAHNETTSESGHSVYSSESVVPESALAPESDGIIVTVENAADEKGSVSLLSAASPSEAASEVGGNLEEIGLEVTEHIDCVDGNVLISAKTPDGKSDEEAAAEALTIPGVVAAQPNYVYELFDAEEDADATVYSTSAVSPFSTTAANDPFAQVSNPSEQLNQYWIYKTGLTTAWQSIKTSGKVTVAVIDVGVKTSHEDLSANVLHELAYDAVSKKAYVEDEKDVLTNGSHGTHVAGIIAAVANNGLGIAGSSYNANLLLIKVNNGSSLRTSYVVNAYQYIMKLAANNPSLNLRIANISLGDTGANDELLHSAIAKARNEYGIVTVCAGGNGDKNKRPRTDPVYPADYEECVSVTSLNKDGTNSYWSDYNMLKDISAPGQGILSTIANPSKQYGNLDGTSMASPIVAGALALLFAAVPDATIEDALNAVYKSATKIVDPENDRSKTSGSHGALNVPGALKFLQDNRVRHFSDVTFDSWYYYPVGRAGYAGIMNGSGGSFFPDRTMTREEAACTLYNYLGNGAVARPCPQTDVDQSAWYANGVNWAVSKGYMNGYDSRRFGVGDTLSREQIASIIANASGANVSKANPAKFNSLKGSSETSSWARRNMIWATDNGLINGVDNIYLMPKGSLPRCQMAAILMNAIDKKII